jgi:hypothetical protein
MNIDRLLSEYANDTSGADLPKLILGAAFEEATVDIEDAAGLRIVNHSDRNGHSKRMVEDMTRVRDLGIPLVRTGINWSLVQTGANTFDWSLVDRKLEVAQQLGLQVCYVLNHYGWRSASDWLKGRNNIHPTENPELSKWYADYTSSFIDRYRDLIPSTIVTVTPAVEICTDLHHRCETEFERSHRPLWAPHHAPDPGSNINRSARERMRANLAAAWNASAERTRKEGVRVMLCEYAPALIDTVPLLEVDLDRDIVGMDYYHHSFWGRERKYHSLLSYLLRWHHFFVKKYGKKPTMMIPEYGTPENWNSFDLEMGEPKYVKPGVCVNRVEDVNQLSWDVHLARAAAVKVAAVFEYVVGGIWHDCLAGNVEREPCNRNGLHDLEWINGNYVPTPCRELIERFKKVPDDEVV